MPARGDSAQAATTGASSRGRWPVLRFMARRGRLALVLVLLSGCPTVPERTAPILDPPPQAAVWPQPPDPARYAFVRNLMGEQDFAGDTRARDTASRVFAWVVGLVLGKAQYLELRRPVGGMTDDAGRIYVVDASHKAVIVFDLAQRQVLKWAQAARGVPFESPVGIVADAKGGFLVTDSQLREVIRLDGRGRPVGRFGAGQLRRPTGIARDAASGIVYVVDTAAHDIKAFNDQGTLVATLGGPGNERGRFNYPTHLALWQRDLYVADTLNFRVQVIGTNGDERLTFGEVGLYVGNLTRPKGVAGGADGRIYVVESYYDHLLIFDQKGRFLLPIKGSIQDIGHFYLPAGVWTDRSGRVYLADMFNGRVAVFKELVEEARR